MNFLTQSIPTLTCRLSCYSISGNTRTFDSRNFADANAAAGLIKPAH